MLVGLPQSLGILLVIAGYYLADIYWMRRFDPQRADQKSARSWRVTTLGFFLTWALLLQPLLFPAWGWRFQGGLILQLLGLLLCTAGLGLNAWSRLHLGRFFTEGIECHADHQVIETGPYQYVRHPIYLSLMSIAGGLLLFSPTPLMLLVTLATWALFFTDAWRDEKLLRASLPGYAAYMERTPRFLPHRWGKRRGASETFEA